MPAVAFHLLNLLRRAVSGALAFALMWGCVFCAGAQAAPFVVRVTEVSTGEESFFRIEPPTLEATSISPVEGQALKPIAKYAVLGHMLVGNKVPLIDADTVLCQFSRDGSDFVVVSAEQTSPTNLFGSFLASMGLYSPVVKVSLVQIKDGRFVARKRLVRKTASFDWKAAAFDAPDGAAR